jgi:hypothetical protein
VRHFFAAERNLEEGCGWDAAAAHPHCYNSLFPITCGFAANMRGELTALHPRTVLYGLDLGLWTSDFGKSSNVPRLGLKSEVRGA